MNPHEFRLESKGRTVEHYKCHHCGEKWAAISFKDLPNNTPCPALEQPTESRPRGAFEQAADHMKIDTSSLEAEIQEMKLKEIKVNGAPLAEFCTCPMHGPTGLMAVGCTCGAMKK